MPNIVLGQDTARRIVECGTKKNRVLLYRVPKTERDKKYRFTETVQVQPIDYSGLFKTVYITPSDYKTTINQTTGESGNTWKYDKDVGCYKATGYLVDWTSVANEQRFAPLQTEKVTVYSSIKVLYKVDDKMATLEDNLALTNLNRMMERYYWVVWMRDR